MAAAARGGGDNEYGCLAVRCEPMLSLDPMRSILQHRLVVGAVYCCRLSYFP